MVHPIFVPASFSNRYIHGAVQTQALHLVFERQTDRRLIIINVHGHCRLIAGRSEDATRHDY